MAKIVSTTTGAVKTGGYKVPTSNLQKSNTSIKGATQRAVGGTKVSVSAEHGNMHQSSAMKTVGDFPSTKMRPL